MSRRHRPYIAPHRLSFRRLALVAGVSFAASAFLTAYCLSPATTAPAVTAISAHVNRNGTETLRLEIQGTPSPPAGSKLSIDITQFAPGQRTVPVVIERVTVFPNAGIGYRPPRGARGVTVLPNANEFAVDDIAQQDVTVQLARPRRGVWRSGMIYIGSATGQRGAARMWSIGPREIRGNGGWAGPGG